MGIIIALIILFFILSMAIASFDVDVETAATAAIIIIAILIVGFIIIVIVDSCNKDKKRDGAKEAIVTKLKEGYPNMTYKGTMGECTFYTEGQNLIIIHADNNSDKVYYDIFEIQKGTKYHIYLKTGFSQRLQDREKFKKDAALFAVAGFLNFGVIYDPSCHDSTDDNCIAFIGIMLYWPDGNTKLIKLSSGEFEATTELRNQIVAWHTSFLTMVDIDGLYRDDDIVI